MFKYLQNIGKSLMMPIAVLPAAAILAGLGNWMIALGILPVVSNILFLAGVSILDNLAILFAIGLAYGLSRDKNGAATLPAIVMWFVIFRLLNPDSLVAILSLNVSDSQTSLEVLADSIGSVQALSFTQLNNAFIGIMIGIVSAELYNKFSKVELPTALTFFSGRRLVPIIAAFVAIIIAVLLFFVWPFVYNGLVVFGETLVDMGAFGAGLYGFFNRLLIPTGLHHALNSVFWFDVAGINDIGNYLSCTAANFDVETGVCALSNGDVAIKGQTGMYQAGFFPIMMFGLPGAALAIYHTALPENKKKVGSIMLAGAVASFFTGVTEPLEFSFMFVAWPLYVLHAFLTGLSMFIASYFGFVNGFGFSAGFVDYVLNFANPLATKPLMLLVQGVGFGFIYYFTFKFAILKFNFLTPGRTKGEFDDEDQFDNIDSSKESKHKEMAIKMLKIIGNDNIVSIDNCATRLRLEVKDSKIIDDSKLKKSGASGVIKPTKDTIQIIVGPAVEFVAEEMKGLR